MENKLNFSSTTLQFSNDTVSLIEWFLLAVALLVVVTLIYVFVLSKSPPPEGITVAKLEQSEDENMKLTDPQPLLDQAQQNLQSNNLTGAVESSVQAVGLVLQQMLQIPTTEKNNLSISDMAYLAESKMKNAPQFFSSTYQLNTLRLRSLQGQPLSQQEAGWAVSFASWFINTLAPHSSS